uniref:type I protein arginine methyltransferase n=1 Tax=Populus tomentosa TaxID=118781 RepID=A0A1I9W0E3_POPTO|nr:protein arginine methyltransferase 4A [Populus tomentosa]
MPNGAVTACKSKFEDKIEPSSAKMYFHYYGQLLHQQNMMQDYVRTGTYYAAVIENRADFLGRVVVDVGAGSGILSLFAAQAGAKHVYAVEASEMAEYARKLIAGNPSLGERITVIKGKVEEVELPEKADILISEPMGTLLVNERMLESYVIARDRFLVPNGKMFPSVGRIHMAPFSDEYLFVEIANKALFWQQQNYYGVDLTPLYGSAFGGYFSQPVVDAFDPRLLVAPTICHVLDFTEIKEEDLYEIVIPLKFIASVGTRVHGLACWFDVLFNGRRYCTKVAYNCPWCAYHPLVPITLCSVSATLCDGRTRNYRPAPDGCPQCSELHSIFNFVSYMWGPGAEQGGILQTSSCKLDLKEPYYRMSQPQAYAMAQDQQPHQPIHTQDIHIQAAEDLEEPELIQQPPQNLDGQLQ